MELSDYLKAIRERWLLILVFTILGAGLAGAITERITPTYAGEASLFLRVDSTGGSLYERSQFALQRIKSYPGVVESPDVLSPVLAELDLGLSLADLKSRVSATNPTGTATLVVRAVDSTPERAAAIANAVSKSLAIKVASIETAQGEAQSSVSLVLTVPASAPTSKTSPNLALNGTLGLLIGLSAGLSVAVLWKRFDQRIRNAEDVRAASGLPLLGKLSRPSGHRALKHLQTMHGQVMATEYQELRANLQLIAGGKLPNILVFVSAEPGCREPNLVLELASSLDRTGRAVCVLEAEYSSSTPDHETATPVPAGVADLLNDTCAVADVLVENGSGNLKILPSGSMSSGPTEFLAQQRFPTAAKELRNSFDVILTHTSPFSEPVSLAMMAPCADGFVLVAEYAKTGMRDLARLLAEAKACGVRPMGVVMVSVPKRRCLAVANDWRPGDFADPAPRLDLERVDGYR